MSTRERGPDLFGEAAGAVAAATPDPVWRSLVDRLPTGSRFGTSTWSFPGWRGIVYGGRHTEGELSRDGLAAYARHPLLRAVGVDRSFYAPLDPATLARMAAAVPAEFRFLMKAHAALTTPRGARRPAFLGDTPEAFLDVDYATRVVIDPAQRLLGDKLGVVLFQFSPLGARVQRHRGLLLERLSAFLRALPRGPIYACEWRDEFMLGADYRAALADAGAVHGLCAHPRMPPVDEQGEGQTMAGPLVVRWLLRRDRRYDEARAGYAPFDRLVDPDPDVRARIAALLRTAAAQGRESIVIVNNKAEGSAPLSIVELARASTAPQAALG